MIAVVVVLLAVRHEQITRLQFLVEAAEQAELEVLAMQTHRIACFLSDNQVPPFRRGPSQVEGDIRVHCQVFFMAVAMLQHSGEGQRERVVAIDRLRLQHVRTLEQQGPLDMVGRSMKGK